jgi:hypothetical protein
MVELFGLGEALFEDPPEVGEDGPPMDENIPDDVEPEEAEA